MVFSAEMVGDEKYYLLSGIPLCVGCGCHSP